MAMSRPGSPYSDHGDNGTIFTTNAYGDSGNSTGDSSDPMATNDINGSFGNNDASGLLMMTLAPNGDYGTNDINGDRGACESKNYSIGVHKNNGRMVPMATMVINVLILTFTQRPNLLPLSSMDHQCLG